MSRSTRLVLALFILLAVGLTVWRALQIYTDFLWFGELGKTGVLRTIWAVRLKLGVLVAVVFFLWLYGNVRLARRLLPKEEIIGQRLLPDAERAAIEQHIDKVLLAFVAMAAVLAGITASGHWHEWIKFFNAVPFGKTDPLFRQDVGFYVFRLPFMQYLWKTGFWAAALGFVVAALIHLYNESIRLHSASIKATVPAQAHCLGLLALCFVLKAAGYRLGMFNLLFTPSGAVPGGPGFSAVHYRLPVFTVQIVACFVCAALTVAPVLLRNVQLPAYLRWLRNLRLPLFLIAAMFLLAVLGAISFPAMMEHWQVRPNALQKELPYIKYNIEATNEAWGLGAVKASDHHIDANLTREEIETADITVKNIRIWDDRPLEDTYRQQQALRQYYEFSGIDVDRYVVGGELRQVSISARQLNYDRVGNLWPNRHLQYTHGYGICMSPVNMVDTEGLPHYWIRDFPPQSEREAANEADLKITHPGLYFMERTLVDPYGYGQVPSPPRRQQPEGAEAPLEEPQPSPERRQTKREVTPLSERRFQEDFVIVGSGVEEIDYPKGAEGQDTVKTVYSGKGGVPLKGLFRKIAFAARFTDWPMLWYNLGPDSRIIFNRWVPDRVEALAPFLRADPNPYPVIYEDRVVWMVDCYTLASRYPYSKGVDPSRGDQNPNYLRNAVKATVDAYDGTTILYLWDPTDPLIQCYNRAFPGLLAPKEEMPVELRKHVRYPRGLFELQTLLYLRYHQHDPTTFFQNEDEWAIPFETLAGDERPVESYYVLMSLPGEDQAEFLLIRPFTPVNREKFNMVAWMAARCDEEHYGELLLYRFPKVQLSYGPMQIEARIDQNEWLADFFRLKAQTNRIIRGHLLVIPLGDSLMYVEPIYLESKMNPVPKLSLVVVASAKGIGYGPTLSQAIELLFRGTPPSPISRPEEAVEEVAAASASTPELAQRLAQVYAEAEALRMNGDFAGYAEKVKELGPLIEELQDSLSGNP
ncbi:MAG: UPF0182 family membrane protein [Candidatus Zipacnadales bacterium]